MANSVDMQLKIHNSLNRDLDKTLKKMETFNDRLSKSDLLSENIGRKWKSSNDLLSGSTSTLNKMLSISRRLVPAIGTIFGGGLIIQGARDVIKYSQSFKELSLRMGDTSKVSQDYSKAMTNVAFSTKLAVEDIGDLMVSLKNLRVPFDNLENATLIVARFSEVTGVGSTEVARMYAEMMRTGRMSQSMTDTVMVGMALMQREFGFSSRELENISDGLITITQRMNQLGKSSTEITRMTKGAMGLAIAFSKVGLEANRAIDFVDDLLNPERIEENAFLYSKLGISISDAFAGNVDIIQMIPRLSELGQQMKELSGPAAVGMARSLGVPLNVLRQFGEISLGLEDQKELARLMGEEGLNASEALAKMHEETRGIDKVFTAIGNVMQTISSKVAVQLGDKFSEIANSIKVMADEGKFDWISNTISKVAEFLLNIPKYIPIIGTGLFVLFKMVKKKAYSVFVEPVKNMTSELRTAMSGVLEMAEQRKNIIKEDKVSPNKGPKEGLFSYEAIARRNKAVDEQNFLLYEFTKAKKEELRASIDVYESEIETMKTRLEFLETLRQSSGLNTKQKVEEVKLNELIYKTEAKQRREEQKMRDVASLEEKKRYNIIKFGSEEAVRAISKEANKRAAFSKQNIKNLDIELENNRRARAESNLILEMLKEEQKLAKSEGRGEDYARIASKVSEIDLLNRSLEESYKRQTEEKKRFVETQKEEQGVIEKIAQMRSIDINDPDYSGQGSFLTRFMDTTDQLYNNLKLSVSNKVAEMGVAFNSLWTGIREKVSGAWETFKSDPIKTTLGAIEKTLGGATKALGTALKSNIGRLIGPMAIMSVAMKMLQPLIEELKPVLDIITDVLKNVLGDILRAIIPPVLKIASAMVPLLAFLVNYGLPPIIMALGGLMTILGTLIKSIGLLAGVFNKEAKKMIEGLGSEFSDSGKETFKMGANMLKKENHIISKEMATDIQDSLVKTADRFGSGDIVLTTKPDKKNFNGGEIYLDKNGNIRIKKGKTEPSFDKLPVDITNVSSGFGGGGVGGGGWGAWENFSINDGIIFKDNKVIKTHEDDNIIATKSTPQVNARSSVYSAGVDSKAEIMEIIENLEEIVSGIQGVLNEGRRSSETLERISSSSNRTASNTRISVAPQLGGI